MKPFRLFGSKKASIAGANRNCAWVGLAKKCKIALQIRIYTASGTPHIYISGEDWRDYSEFVRSGETVEEVIMLLLDKAPSLGWKEPIQLSLF